MPPALRFLLDPDTTREILTRFPYLAGQDFVD